MHYKSNKAAASHLHVQTAENHCTQQQQKHMAGSHCKGCLGSGLEGSEPELQPLQYEHEWILSILANDSRQSAKTVQSATGKALGLA